MASELISREVTGDGEAAEMSITLADDFEGASQVNVSVEGETVLALQSRRSSPASSEIKAVLGGRLSSSGEVTATLNISGELPQLVQGSIGDFELTDTDAEQLSAGQPPGQELVAALGNFDFKPLLALPLDELIRKIQTAINREEAEPQWALPRDNCKDCKAQCFIKYIKCLSGCGDPGTIPGAICWVRCIAEADKCDRACPCQPL